MIVQVQHKSWGYGRASTEKQEDSPKVQEDKFETWWTAQKTIGKYPGIELGGWFADAAVTAKIGWFNRPAAQELLIQAQPGDLIVISRQDRAVRSTKDACSVIESLDQFGLYVVFMDNPQIDLTTIEGRAFFKVMATFSEMEREMISKRTKEALAWRKKNNLPHGLAPRGWQVVVDKNGKKKLIPHKQERTIARYVIELNEKYELSIERIYWHLRKSEVVNPRTGREYSVQTLRELCRCARADFPKRNEDFNPYLSDGGSPYNLKRGRKNKNQHAKK